MLRAPRDRQLDCSWIEDSQRDVAIWAVYLEMGSHPPIGIPRCEAQEHRVKAAAGIIETMAGEGATRNSARKRIRLDVEAYAELGRICSVTIAVQRRQPVFARADLAAAAVRAITDHAKARGVPLWAYCVMPDHIHLIIEASEECDIVTFVGQVKSLIQREAWRVGMSGTFWQSRF